jgi:methyl-accepting chemotaxis protein
MTMMRIQSQIDTVILSLGSAPTLRRADPYLQGAAGERREGDFRLRRHRLGRSVTSQEDIEGVAGQMADLTHTVEEMALQLKTLRKRADDQVERSNTQQERIDLAARELTEVSDRLQSAANALRESI